MVTRGWWRMIGGQLARLLGGMRAVLVLAVLVGAYAGCSSSDAGGDGAEALGTTAEALTLAEIWGFESPSAWTLTSGTGSKQAGTVHDQGSYSLELAGTSFLAVRGDAVSKPTAVSPLLALDVMIPTQAGPYYYGAIQLSISVPSLNIYSQWINQRELSMPTGVWQTLTFQLPDNIYQQLLNSPFDDLQFTIGVNPPQGVTQPFRLDNLRFLPAPSCVGQPDGTLCDDSVACTTGNTCNGGVCGTVTPPPPGSSCDPADDVMGFENFPAWQVTNGSAAVAPSTTHVQGVRSLQVTTPYYTTVSSIKLSTLHKVGQTLSLRVRKPTNQPNQYWHGDLTLAMSVPSLGINYSQTVQLLGHPNGTFFELTFQVPPNVVQTLANNGYDDLSFSISINPPNGQSGFYLLDDLHFVPVTSCTGAINKTACDDNSLCTQGDSCQGGVCGVAVVCNDGNLCTDDSCNPATGCVFSNNTAPCSDGNACTAADRCAGGACVPGAPVTCNDGNVCTDDSCNPATGCVYTNNTAPCSDGDACTTGDQCSAGACIPGGPTNCDDGNPCTTESCVSPTGCVYTDAGGLCSDGNLCTGVLPDGTDSCSAGACVAGPPVNCDDGSACTNDSCDPAGGCVHSFACGTGVCVGNACCQPATCASLHAECGVHADGCGGTVDCNSICAAGGTCNPAFQCLPPNQFQQKTGTNVCEILLDDLVIPAVTHEVDECLSFDFWDCALGAASGHPDCCIPGSCLLDPFCYVSHTVTDVAEQVYHKGDIYCDFRSPEEYLERILNGSISSVEEWGTFIATGGLSGLIDFDITVLTNAGHQAPANVRNLIRALTAPVYDGGATGINYDQMDSVKIVSSDFPTGGFYLPGDRLAITLGPVIVMKAPFYKALFADSNSGVTYQDFLTNPSVCAKFIAAVDILIHELVHVRQYNELGRVNFQTQYLGSALANGYGGIGFEREAFTYELQIEQLQGGRLCSVTAEDASAYISAFGLPVPQPTCPSDGLQVWDIPACP